jgi:branched-chain amino acid transport system ATP-binding protein
MLTVSDLETYYGSSYVLQGISIEVPDGTLVSVLGRNGVGKTTLVKTIIGLVAARSGTVTFDDADISHWAPEDIARRGIAFVPQGRMIFPTLTVEENLLIGARQTEYGDWTIDRVYDLFSNLAARKNNRGTQLSGGEQQMLAIGRALMTNPKLLLLDEPSEGLAPLLVQQVSEAINVARGPGVSVLLVEQKLRFALNLSDRVYLMTKGKVVYEGDPSQLSRDKEAQERYLGLALV